MYSVSARFDELAVVSTSTNNDKKSWEKEGPETMQGFRGKRSPCAPSNQLHINTAAPTTFNSAIHSFEFFVLKNKMLTFWRRIFLKGRKLGDHEKGFMKAACRSEKQTHKTKED